METFKAKYNIGAGTYNVRLLEDLKRTHSGRIIGVSGFAEKNQYLDQYLNLPTCISS